jgi:hypothetical protein
MRAFLDDAPLPTERPTLAAAIRAGSARAQQSGRVVVEVFVDGQQAGESLLDQPSDDPTTSEIRLVSIAPRELVRQTMLDCIDALQAANTDQLETARLVQAGKIEEALEPLGRAVGTWQAVRDAIERSTAILHGRQNLESPALHSLLEGLAGRLEEIRSSLAREDWCALADVLAYDMPEQVKQWSDALAELAGRLK